MHAAILKSFTEATRQAPSQKHGSNSAAWSKVALWKLACLLARRAECRRRCTDRPRSQEGSEKRRWVKWRKGNEKMIEKCEDNLL